MDVNQEITTKRTITRSISLDADAFNAVIKKYLPDSKPEEGETCDGRTVRIFVMPGCSVGAGEEVNILDLEGGVQIEMVEIFEKNDPSITEE